MRMVQGTTIVLLCMMATCIMIGVVILMKQRAKAQLQKEADERIKVEKKKEISDQLFWGISQIVDCFATSFKTLSPISWPYVSFTGLKRSRSI